VKREINAPSTQDPDPVRQRIESVDLWDSESKYRLLADNASDVIWTCDKTGRFTYVSPSVERLRGYTPEEVMAQTWEEALTPESLEKATQLFSQRFSSNNADSSPINRVELEQPCKDGGSVWTETITSPLRDIDGKTIGIVGVSRNINERKAVESALKESERRFRDLVDLAPQPMFELDENGYFTFISKRAQEYFGFTREQIEGGIHGLELIAPESRELAVERLKRALAGEELTNLEYRALRSDGSSFPCLILTCPIIKNEKPAGLRGIVVDISDWKKAEELNLNAERLKAITELASGVSHNFNNALQIIQGNAQIALLKAQKEGFSGVVKHLEQIVRNSKLASETVNRLNSFSRGQTDSNSPEVVDLSALAKEALEMSRVWRENLKASQGVTITVSDHLAANCLVTGKQGELLEVMLNLIKNALEAMPNGGEIQISTSVKDQWARFMVRDNGTGMSDEVRRRVFDPFFSGKGPKSSGMGLAVSHGIIKSHGGSITVESQPGKGSVFRIELPLKRVDIDPDPKLTIQIPEIQGTILVVDDLRPVLEMISEGLRAAGHEVLTAMSGAQAIEMFKEKDRIDLIICDLAMPDMNGWEVWENLRDLCRKNHVREPSFIILSGLNEPEFNEKIHREAQRIPILKKPIDMDSLTMVVGKSIFAENMTARE
jgi:PAS domain S-box-containing protein